MTLPVPYPGSTKTKGWVFELDTDRVQQSDTWALALPEVRPWLLMMWFSAWGLTPSGSLPGDEAVLIARLGIKAEFFQQHRSLLMRGWALAEDGRYYHETITDLVLQMLDRRKSEAERKAEYRAKKDSERLAEDESCPEMSHGTDAGLPRESTRNPTLTNDHRPLTIKDKKTEVNARKRAARKRASPPDKPADVAESIWADFLELRKARRATLTPTALAGIKAEAAKAGIGLEQALSHCCAAGWQGFNAGWYLARKFPAKGQGPPEGETFRERDARQARAQWEQMTGRQHPDNLDAGVVDVHPIVLEITR